jgi:hypothetical protein
VIQTITPLRGRLPALAVLSLVVTLAACAGVTPQQYCYMVSAATVHSVDLGMNVAGDLYRAGKITDAQKAKITAPYDKYQPIAVAVVTACKAVDTQAAADVETKKIQGEADKVLTALVAAGAK